MERFFRLLVAGTLVVAGPAAHAASPQRTLQNTFGVAVNPIGLEDRFALSWKWPLYRTTNPVLSESHFSLGATETLSPTYNRVQAWVALAPLSILELRAGVEPAAYFGTFGHLIGFSGYDADFSNDVLKARRDEASGGLGVRWYVSPTLQGRAGRVLAWARAEIEWWRVDAPGEVFYEPTRGTLLDSDGDRAVATSSLLLYEVPKAGGERLLFGLAHELVSVRGAPANRRQRVGVVGTWVLATERFGVREPTVYASVLHNFEDPVREGQVSGVLAVIFNLGK